MKIPVHRIIPFSNVEGLGNRTSIFVQGCNANCLYCHNPETIPMKSESSKLHSVDELIDIVKDNMPFIRGITVSGGEATIYHDFLKELFEKVHELGLTCYVDTNGFFDMETIGGLIGETDKFLFDIKGIGKSLENLCFSSYMNEGNNFSVKNIMGFSSEGQHFDNLEELTRLNKVEEVRLVYIKGYYDERKIVREIKRRIRSHPETTLKLIRVHGRGIPKERIMKLKGLIPSKSELDTLAEYAIAEGIVNVQRIY